MSMCFGGRGTRARVSTHTKSDIQRVLQKEPRGPGITVASEDGNWSTEG